MSMWERQKVQKVSRSLSFPCLIEKRYLSERGSSLAGDAAEREVSRRRACCPIRPHGRDKSGPYISRNELREKDDGSGLCDEQHALKPENDRREMHETYACIIRKMAIHCQSCRGPIYDSEENLCEDVRRRWRLLGHERVAPPHPTDAIYRARTLRDTHVKMTQNHVSRPQGWGGAVVRTEFPIGVMSRVRRGGERLLFVKNLRVIYRVR
jgi:hypothetical protein